MTQHKPEAPQSEENIEDFAALLEAHGKSSEHLHTGQRISAVVIALTADSVFLDVGIKVDGVMDRKDILDANGETAVAVGDSIDAWVVGVSAHEIKLSRSMSGSGIAALEDARDAGIPVDGRIVASCKGGYTVEVMGKTAFCPGSQIDGGGSDSDALVGTTQQFVITRIENHGRNIVVSRRALLAKERQENLDTLLKNLKEGDTVEGKITRLATFGAFLEIAPAVEGMIHISELSWSRVSNADEAVSPGDCVRAKVLSITQDEKGNTRISLSRKKAEGDPWLSAEGRLTPGQVVPGRVMRLAPFGAFVEVLPGVEGLVHLSEMSWTKRINKAEEAVTVGETVSVKVKDFSVERRRLSLSLRDAEGDPWSEVAERFPLGTIITGTVESRAQFGLFVNLMPGVTGLLPNAVTKNSPLQGQLAKLNKGDSVTLIVQAVDIASKRISLAPEGSEPLEDTSWKNHPAAAANNSAPAASSFGNLGQALQAALQKKL
ncbi:MAG: 30S ribosomal protein S1 [Desulfovibrionaceae bacterium]